MVREKIHNFVVVKDNEIPFSSVTCI